MSPNARVIVMVIAVVVDVASLQRRRLCDSRACARTRHNKSYCVVCVWTCGENLMGLILILNCGRVRCFGCVYHARTHSFIVVCKQPSFPVARSGGRTLRVVDCVDAHTRTNVRDVTLCTCRCSYHRQRATFTRMAHIHLQFIYQQPRSKLCTCERAQHQNSGAM